MKGSYERKRRRKGNCLTRLGTPSLSKRSIICSKGTLLYRRRKKGKAMNLSRARMTCSSGVVEAIPKQQTRERRWRITTRYQQALDTYFSLPSCHCTDTSPSGSILPPKPSQRPLFSTKTPKKERQNEPMNSTPSVPSNSFLVVSSKLPAKPWKVREP